MKANEGLVAQIILLFIWASPPYVAEVRPSRQRTDATSGKLKRICGPHLWEALYSCCPHTSWLLLGQFLVLLLPRPLFRHTELNTSTQYFCLLPCACSLISIPVKDQESTRPGKCYPDKQNSKYLHSQGLHCTLPTLLFPFSVSVSLLCLLSYISHLAFPPTSLFSVFHPAFCTRPRAFNPPGLILPKRGMTAGVRGDEKAETQPSQKLHSGFCSPVLQTESQLAAKSTKSLCVLSLPASPENTFDFQVHAKYMDKHKLTHRCYAGDYLIV